MKRIAELSLFSICISMAAVSPSRAQDWLYRARIAGTEMDIEMSNAEIFNVLDELRAQRVSVVEAETLLGNHLTPAAFDSEIVFITRVALYAQQLGLRLVWYYPSLKVVSPTNQLTMFAQHPDWVQYGLNTSYSNPDTQIPNVLTEPSDEVGAPDIEIAWMCHLSPYRDVYFERIRKLAATGIDGIWIDETLFSDFIDLLPCSNVFCRQKFQTDTGLSFPTSSEALADTAIISQNFRRWMIWRHTELSQFLIDIRNTARGIDPDLEIIVNTPTMDNNDATRQGLDMTYLDDAEGITINWQIPPISQSSAMRNAQLNDWMSFIAMNKFGRGTSGPGLSGFVLTSGLSEDDASLVLAEGLAAKLNPHATKVPERTGLISRDHRARAFSFAESFNEVLFQSQSSARVAIIYSSPSRDFLDHLEGRALYPTANPPVTDVEWWTEDPADGVLSTNYIAEYRGWVKALISNHIPFDIIPVQHLDAQSLPAYQTIILPDAASLSGEKGQLISNYIDSGGMMVTTGTIPFLLDEFGIPLLNPLSSKLLQPLSNVVYSPVLVGKESLKDTIDANLGIQQIISRIATPERLITTDAPATIHFELYKQDQKYILHSTNFNAIDQSQQPSPATFSVTLDLPETAAANGITVISPESSDNIGEITFTAVSSGRVTFDLTVNLYAVAIISFDNVPIQPYKPVRLPTTFAVSKSFPNPFQSHTTFNFELAVNSEVVVEIYNVIGRKIRTLAKGNRRANVYTITWDGNDDAGNSVPNGIYFCHLRAGIEDHFMKLSLVR